MLHFFLQISAATPDGRFPCLSSEENRQVAPNRLSPLFQDEWVARRSNAVTCRNAIDMAPNLAASRATLVSSQSRVKASYRSMERDQGRFVGCGRSGDASLRRFGSSALKVGCRPSGAPRARQEHDARHPSIEKSRRNSRHCLLPALKSRQVVPRCS
jgi:hypothetical protein